MKPREPFRGKPKKREGKPAERQVKGKPVSPFAERSHAIAVLDFVRKKIKSTPITSREVYFRIFEEACAHVVNHPELNLSGTARTNLLRFIGEDAQFREILNRPRTTQLQQGMKPMEVISINGRQALDLFKRIGRTLKRSNLFGLVREEHRPDFAKEKMPGFIQDLKNFIEEESKRISGLVKGRDKPVHLDAAAMKMFLSWEIDLLQRQMKIQLGSEAGLFFHERELIEWILSGQPDA